MRTKFGKGKAKAMEDDLRIVASASRVAKAIATFNRKTMANEDQDERRFICFSFFSLVP